MILALFPPNVFTVSKEDRMQDITKYVENAKCNKLLFQLLLTHTSKAYTWSDKYENILLAE